MISISWLQATILLESPLDSLNGLAEKISESARLATTGSSLRLQDHDSANLLRLLGDEGHMLAIAQVPGRVGEETLKVPLSSSITGMICPDMPERLRATRAHLRITVSREGTADAVANTQAIIGSLHMLGQITALLCRSARPLAVHWAQSEQLLPPAAFLELEGEGVPGALHVHPFLFGGSGLVGLRTYGARHFIGRELLLQPHEADFSTHYDAMLALLRFAADPEGFLIPDGDSFALPDGKFDYLVIYRDAEDDGVPLLELQPLVN